MAGRFDRQIATAARLIQKNGQLVDFVSRVKSIDDNFNEIVSEVRHKVWICFIPYKSDIKQFMAYISGKELKSGTVLGLMAGNVPFAPDLTDFVERDGVRIEILRVGKLSPNGQSILYKLELKE